ncbi:MAG: signal transduction histidine kinase [Cyclobacteriaceae bacterium]|jgi:signal transduction histidine kinase
MRLIIKITIIYALIAFFVFLIGGYINYTVMSREIDKEQRFFLNDRLKHVITWIEKRNLDKPHERNKLKITPLPEMVEETKGIYSDTLAMHEDLQRIEPHIKLDVIKNINGRSYKIMLYDLIIESDDIEDVVKETMFKTYLILLLTMLIISFIVSYYIFKPFHETLRAIKSFSIRSNKKIYLTSPSTAEFKKLNHFIEEMTNQVIIDYKALKEFSENASHEIQTPLSIADGKLELLLGYPNLNEEQMELIISARNALKRLSKTNNSLSLLTKIENREFADFTAIDFSTLVKNILSEFKELIELKSIKLESQIESDVQLSGNQVLLELMVSNLLNNAVRHNYSEGYIRLTLTKQQLIIENSGNELCVNTETLFQRFRKGTDHPDSSGLGLSIVQLICGQHHFQIEYSISDKQHRLSVSFVSKV